MKRANPVMVSFILCMIICYSHSSISTQHDPSVNSGYKILTSNDLLERINSGEILYLIDCRPADEFNAGHISGAVNVSMDSFGFEWDTLVKKNMAEIEEAEGGEMSLVLIDVEDGEEYMPRSKLEELTVTLPLDTDLEVLLH